MSLNIEFDKFNSDIFEIKMGNITNTESNLKNVDINYIGTILTQAQEEKYEHLCIKVPSDDAKYNEMLNKHKFYNVGSQIMFKLSTYTDNSKVSMPQLLDNISFGELSGDGDVCDIARISRRSFILDRFHKDKFLPKEKADSYYEKWAINCCKGFSDQVFVLSVPEYGVVGYITLKKTGHEAKVDLAAIEPKFQGHGLFKYMIFMTLRRLQDEGINYFFYGTQGENNPVIRTMQIFGAKTCSHNNVLHCKL